MLQFWLLRLFSKKNEVEIRLKITEVSKAQNIPAQRQRRGENKIVYQKINNIMSNYGYSKINIFFLVICQIISNFVFNTDKKVCIKNVH